MDKLTKGAKSYRDYEGKVNIRLKWADRDTFRQLTPKTEAPSFIFNVAKMCN